MAGKATLATFSAANGATYDSAGNLYIADSINNRIRKVDTSGIIKTFAGNGTQGFSGDGGQATAAALNYPYGVVVDKSGNLYISGDNRIRKVDTNGIITTFAGNGAKASNGQGTYSGDGGPATAAGLGDPSGIAFDTAGNLYICDLQNNRVRKVDKNGIITTFAGNGLGKLAGEGGPAAAASLYAPSALTFDSLGNLYILDTGNLRVRRVDTNGIISTYAGNGVAGFSGDGGPATSATLNRPEGITCDKSGNIYIADYNNDRVRVVTVLPRTSSTPPSITGQPSNQTVTNG